MAKRLEFPDTSAEIVELIRSSLAALKEKGKEGVIEEFAKLTIMRNEHMLTLIKNDDIPVLLSE